MTKYKGKITISRYNSNVEDKTPVKISIEESDSQISFLEISMALETFAECLMGLGYSDCLLEIRGLDKIGKKQENKTEKVYVGKEYSFTPEREKELLSPYEIDGWIARSGDLGNYHHRDNKGYVSVIFTRWV